MKLITIGFLLSSVIICAQGEISQARISKFELLTRPSSLTYSWLKKNEYGASLINRFKLLEGFILVDVKKGSYEEWLRFLPIEPKKAKIKLYNGKNKFLQVLNAGVKD